MKSKKTKEVRDAERRIVAGTDSERAVKFGGHVGEERRSGIEDRRGTWKVRRSDSNTAGGPSGRGL